MVKTNLNDSVIIYTDGACRGNPGPGGWGALLRFGAQQKTIRGFADHTTNNRMELQAAIAALNCLTKRCKVDLYTDSQYLQNGVSKWLAVWKKNNWRTADKKTVKNRDLWVSLDELSQQHQINWHWVRGHCGDVDNEHADQLANQAINENIK